MRKNIKLLALDFDGTILDSGKKFPVESVNALYDLAHNDVKIVASSGRGLAELADYSREMQVFHYGILSSGGLVYDFCKKKILSQQNMELDNALQIIAAGRQEHAMVHVLTTDISAVQQDVLPYMDQFKMGVYQGMFNRIAKPVEDIAAFVHNHAHDLLKVNLYHRSPVSRLRNRKHLQGLGVNMADAETTSLEFSQAGISKAYGLQVLCEHLHLSCKDCAAIGDAPNDLEILQAAGFSIAMGNALSCVKSTCDVVTTDNDHNGVFHAIRQYFS
mgnify:CR=1 FL=1